jgi:hypothetical protein
MRITGDGNVGIGTPNPDSNAKLHIAGIVKTNTVSLSDSNPSDGGINISDFSSTMTHRLLATHGNNGGLWQVSGRGGLAFGSGDDCLILGTGDNWDTYTDNSYGVDTESENVYIAADGQFRLNLGLQDGWSSEYQKFDRYHHYLDGRASGSSAEHWTYYRNHGGSVYKVGYGTSESKTGLKLYSDNDIYLIESDDPAYVFRFDVNFDKFYLNGTLTTLSDDRLKFNEKRIQGATGTLMKLDPQIYDKKRFLNSNIMTHEAGFIAQDVWYDVPEMRHLVTLSKDAEPSKERPSTPEDIQDDPDWNAAGWGEEESHLCYNGMIPYIVKSIQEIVTEKTSERTRVTNGGGDLSGLIVSATTDAFTSEDKPVLSLSNVYCDRACFGVVSDVAPTLINTRGTGRVWVLSSGTSLVSGDYVTTSNIFPGYACAQSDDITRSYTVAKITQNCDFAQNLRPKRVIKQELSNVNYYVNTNHLVITEEEYSDLDEAKRMTEIETYHEWEGRELVEEGEAYDYIKISPEISLEDYEALHENEKSKYKLRRFKKTTTESSEPPEGGVAYETKTRTIYKRLVRQEHKTQARNRELEVREELVNVLDEHGQIQWEDDPSGATEPTYKIRYLTADGQITDDESNAVHIAAFVGCTYHCG